MNRHWLLMLVLPVFGGCGLLEPVLPDADPGTPSDWPGPPTALGGGWQ
ncbi:MAG: hypothetical protein WD078_04940 [Woeseia sp.]